MRINPNELREFVENNPKLVSRKESVWWPGLYVLKYRASVFYDALWDQHEMTKYARGLVVDEHYNVVVKPFTKVFNVGETPETNWEPDDNVRIVRKVNGFMGCATYRPHISDKIIYSTTGSLDSAFVDLIEKHVKQYEDYIKTMYENCTLIFEICDPSDPHIIEEKPGAYLIGGCEYRDREGTIFEATEPMLDAIAKYGDMLRPEWYDGVRYADLLASAKNFHHEGWMIYGNGKAGKLKTPYYLLTKLLARAGIVNLAERLLANEAYSLKQKYDEEYYPLLDFLFERRVEFSLLPEQARIKMIRDFLEGQ